MLLVFAFSITPQQIIHDAVAKHLDPTSCSVHQNLPIEQIESTQLHCTFDFQVATAPFIFYHFELPIQAPVFSAAQNDIYKNSIPFYFTVASESRGPPTICI
jgi:hypothetical protein